jgi:hypothetical protein
MEPNLNHPNAHSPVDIEQIGYRVTRDIERFCYDKRSTVWHRKNVVLRRLTYLICVTTAGFGLFYLLPPAHLGMATLGLCSSLICATLGCWTLKGIRFCGQCEAVVRWPLLGMSCSYCLNCSNLVNAAQIITGAPGVMSLVGPDYLEHSEPIPRLLAMHTLVALKDGASEIHFISNEDRLEVFFVVGGVSYEAVPPPAALRRALSQTILAIAGLPFEKERQPQEGRIRVQFEGRALEIVVRTEPTDHGERVVLRCEP